MGEAMGWREQVIPSTTRLSVMGNLWFHNDFGATKLWGCFFPAAPLNSSNIPGPALTLGWLQDEVQWLWVGQRGCLMKEKV